MAHQQSYATHAHRPRATYAATILALVAAGLFAAAWGGRSTLIPGLFLLTISVLILLWISRAYIVRLQDRIIRLEMRLRTDDVLTPEQRELFRTLSRRQIVALRFASDPELPGLVERAAREGLTGDEIKRAITNWVPDYERT